MKKIAITAIRSAPKKNVSQGVTLLFFSPPSLVTVCVSRYSAMVMLHDNPPRNARVAAIVPGGAFSGARAAAECCATMRELFRERLHRLCERHVFLRYAARIVGRERHLDRTVDIEPLGMVIHFFRHER